MQWEEGGGEMTGFPGGEGNWYELHLTHKKNVFIATSLLSPICSQEKEEINRPQPLICTVARSAF